MGSHDIAAFFKGRLGTITYDSDGSDDDGDDGDDGGDCGELVRELK